MGFINIARILRDRHIKSSLPTTSVKLGLSLSTKIFTFNQFVNRLDLDAFLSNLERLPRNCGELSYADNYHKYIVTGDLRIIKNNVLKQFRESKPINSYKAESCIPIDLG